MTMDATNPIHRVYGPRQPCSALTCTLCLCKPYTTPALRPAAPPALSARILHIRPQGLSCRSSCARPSGDFFRLGGGWGDGGGLHSPVPLHTLHSYGSLGVNPIMRSPAAAAPTAHRTPPRNSQRRTHARSVCISDQGRYGACRMHEGRRRLRKSRFSGPKDSTP